MTRPEDDFTSTPEAAEAYEKWRAEHDYEDFDDGLDEPRPARVCTHRDRSECFCPDPKDDE